MANSYHIKVLKVVHNEGRMHMILFGLVCERMCEDEKKSE